MQGVLSRQDQLERDGETIRMSLSSDVLFSTGSARLQPGGEDKLRQVAGVRCQPQSAKHGDPQSGHGLNLADQDLGSSARPKFPGGLDDQGGQSRRVLMNQCVTGASDDPDFRQVHEGGGRFGDLTVGRIVLADNESHRHL